MVAAINPNRGFADLSPSHQRTLQLIGGRRRHLDHIITVDLDWFGLLDLLGLALHELLQVDMAILINLLLFRTIASIMIIVYYPIRFGVEPTKSTSMPCFLSLSCSFSFIVSLSCWLICSTANPKGLSCSSNRVLSITTFLTFSFFSSISF